MNKFPTILLADDDPEDRMIMAESFTELGVSHAAHFVENGEKVLAYLDNIIADEYLPKLVVLDLNMPRMNGTQTLKALKANVRYKEIPVVIYSTSVNTIEMQECLKTGALAYIVKPVTYKECVETAKSFYEFAENGKPLS